MRLRKEKLLTYLFNDHLTYMHGMIILINQLKGRWHLQMAIEKNKETAER